MQKKPEDRYNDTRELVADLEKVHSAVAAGRAALPSESSKSMLRRASILAGALVLLAGALFMTRIR